MYSVVLMSIACNEVGLVYGVGLMSIASPCNEVRLVYSVVLMSIASPCNEVGSAYSLVLMSIASPCNAPPCASPRATGFCIFMLGLG